MTDQLDRIDTILTDVDDLLRQRMTEIGVELVYFMVAISPDGKPLVRGNVDPEGLKQLAKEIEEVANEPQPHEYKPVH